MLAQEASREHDVVPAKHSLTSAQDVPLPVNPTLQEHVNEPAVLVHAAFSEHEFARLHSKMSLQLTPLPVHPALQEHV